MKPITKGIFRYALLAPFDILGTISAYLFVNWWAPLFARHGWLPDWLKWFQTFDADLDTGVRGGKFTAKSRYCGRVHWLYRNPAYGWSYYVLGARFSPESWKVVRNDQVFYAVSTEGYFNYIFRKWGFEFKLGWKASNYLRKDGAWSTSPWGPLWRVPIVTSIRLLKKGA